LDELKEDSERLRHALQASEKKYQVFAILIRTSDQSNWVIGGAAG